MGNLRPRALAKPLAPASALRFYHEALSRLIDSGVPFLVGGGYAFRHYTGIERWTKDLDVFVRPRDAERVLGLLEPVGTRVELPFPHWLGKVHGGDAFLDVVFGSGNGVAEVDDGWFEHATDGTVLGLSVRMCPAEETIWSKAFIAERERYDGADIAHLILARGDTLDWSRLLRRFGEHWRVLLSHLVLFPYIYPGHRDRVPAWVVSALMRRQSGELAGFQSADAALCRGPLLSREQYLPDLDVGRFGDARLAPVGRMTASDIDIWTRAIEDDDGHEARRRR